MASLTFTSRSAIRPPAPQLEISALADTVRIHQATLNQTPTGTNPSSDWLQTVITDTAAIAASLREIGPRISPADRPLQRKFQILGLDLECLQDRVGLIVRRWQEKDRERASLASLEIVPHYEPSEWQCKLVQCIYNRADLAWVFENAREQGIVFSKEIMFRPLRQTVFCGDTDAVRVYAKYLDFSTLHAYEQKELVDICIEKGYLTLLPVLNLPISPTQATKLEKLRADDAAANARYQSMLLHNKIMESCRWGDTKSLTSDFENAKERGIFLSKEEIVPALKEAIYLGSEDIARIFVKYLDFSTLRGHEQELVDLCIEKGYPELLSIFNLPISRAQATELEKLRGILASVANRADVEPPQPINPPHARVHGGDANLAIYEREYRRGVAVLVYYMTRADFDPEKMIEMSGYIRKRQAILGGQKPLSEFGEPTCETIETAYGPEKGEGPYCSFGKKIRAMYGDALPLTARITIDGMLVRLSSLTTKKWTHPSGHDRPIVVKELARILGSIHKRDFAPTDAKTITLMLELNRFYWLMAQFPLFHRGNPTALAMLTDATLISKGRTALDKRTTDVNCEALCYIDLERFKEEVFMRLPRPAVVA